MAISLASLKRSTALSSPRILAHGVAGVGKSTVAALDWLGKSGELLSPFMRRPQRRRGFDIPTPNVV